MARRSLLAFVVVAACVGREERAPPDTPPTAPPAAPAPPAGGAAAPADAKPDAPQPAQTTVRSGGDGRCEPMPKAGDPCGPGDGYCVLSWGSPGGWSSALWCRQGRWAIEEERNLPDDGTP